MAIAEVNAICAAMGGEGRCLPHAAPTPVAIPAAIRAGPPASTAAKQFLSGKAISQDPALKIAGSS
jgi:hypothetical protein